MKYKDVPVGSTFTDKYWGKQGVSFTRINRESYDDAVWNVPPDHEYYYRNGKKVTYGPGDYEVELIIDEETIP